MRRYPWRGLQNLPEQFLFQKTVGTLLFGQRSLASDGDKRKITAAVPDGTDCRLLFEILENFLHCFVYRYF